MAMRADLHVHTVFSKDSLASVEGVLDAAVKRGMGAVAITDHDTIEGALAAQRLAGARKLALQVIVGEEVGTEEGDLLVYFLKERIAPGPLARVLEEAGRQKAVCCAAHPYDFARRGIALGKLPAGLLSGIGCVEAFNARVTLAPQNAQAMEFALSHGKPILAGSDAHHASEVGGAYVEFGLGKGEVLGARALLHAQRKIGGRRASPLVRLHTRYAVLRKKFARLFPVPIK